ncbi:MAG: hypothetical protein J5819_03505 [Eubacterium sp.]|nr:hypothetical protein [Eubacterium sp.]
MIPVNELKIEPETVELKNRNTGEDHRFILRLYRDGDETGMIECIRSEYGEKYFKSYFYDPCWIREHAHSDKYTFFVAETEGRIAGMEIFVYSHGVDECIEPASEILHSDYRGTGLSPALVDYTYRILDRVSPCAVFVHAVTFHDATQITCEKEGMIPVGFRLGRFLSKNLHISYAKGRPDKYSEGIMILPMAKRSAGTIWLPEELVPFGKKIYDRLGVSCRILTASDTLTETTDTEVAVTETTDTKNTVSATGRVQSDKHKCFEESEVDITVDEVQQFVGVQVITEGRDLAEKMRALVSEYRGKGMYTIQIALFDDTPSVLEIYERLKKIGFFFTGLKPVCGKREQFFMQWMDEWNLFMEDYVLTDSFREIADDIGEFYGRRITD